MKTREEMLVHLERRWIPTSWGEESDSNPPFGWVLDELIEFGFLNVEERGK